MQITCLSTPGHHLGNQGGQDLLAHPLMGKDRHQAGFLPQGRQVVPPEGVDYHQTGCHNRGHLVDLLEGQALTPH